MSSSLRRVIMNDDEFVRYLASYLESNQEKFVFSSFDRNASHNAGEYREYTYISREGLEDLIKQFRQGLP